MNFVTVADYEHYPWLSGLFTSIYKHNKNHEINIIVFDIGLLSEQVKALEAQNNIQVVPIEMVHPDLCKKFVVRKNGRLARGWYAWKPVVFYQALNYFDYFLYIDSGMRVRAPLDIIFAAIQQDGYFFYTCHHKIRPTITKYILNKFNLNQRGRGSVLEHYGMLGGLQGLSKSMLTSYIKPMYELAHDLRNFEDDGTAPWGFGGARHDQSLFSLLARLSGYIIHDNFVTLDSKKISFKMDNFITVSKNIDENILAAQCHLVG
jgi:hypothetical protein